MKTRKRKPQKNPEELITGILGNRWSQCFLLLEVCGEECARYDNVGSSLWHALAPSEAFENKHSAVYMSHVAELLSRASRGERIDTYTSAEILLAMVETSTVAPLNSLASGIYHRMFRECMGEENYAVCNLGDVLFRERFPGQVQDEIDALKAKPSPSKRIRKAESRPSPK